jgi:hypothetical protein
MKIPVQITQHIQCHVNRLMVIWYGTACYATVMVWYGMGWCMACLIDVSYLIISIISSRMRYIIASTCDNGIFGCTDKVQEFAQTLAVSQPNQSTRP